MDNLTLEGLLEDSPLFFIPTTPTVPLLRTSDGEDSNAVSEVAVGTKRKKRRKDDIFVFQ